jgi:hypothetical protein
MAEWFKATDLRPVIYDAWVRTPLRALPPFKGGLPNWLNWIEHKTSKHL